MRTLSFIDIKIIDSIGSHRRSFRTTYREKKDSSFSTYSFDTRCLLFRSKEETDNTTKILLSLINPSNFSLSSG
jgi:hypothetical protein